MKTSIVIIGAGPAGLLLGHLLTQAGINCTILERQTPEYVLGRIRAGILERGTIQLLEELNLDGRCKTEGLPHDGLLIAHSKGLIEIDVRGLTGKQVFVYGQTEITKDLMEAAPTRGLPIIYEAENVSLHDIETDTPSVTYEKDGTTHSITTRFIAGCDGYHGPSRQSIPASEATFVEKSYPFGWLGILADVPPATDEAAYASHERGFALASMRSRTRSRYYIQVDSDEKLEDWPDERLWDELAVRLGPTIAGNLTRGPALEKSIAQLRSFIFEKMRYGSLFLAGDAAHIVPPTGAKGLNLAASDIAYLAPSLISYFVNGSNEGIDTYEARALARVWKSSRFSWYLTNLLHKFPENGEFGHKMQMAELNYVASSKAAQTIIAENYIGLPL